MTILENREHSPKNNSVAAITSEHIRLKFSQLLHLEGLQGKALLHISYPPEDLHRKSFNRLVDVLSSHGLHDVASFIECKENYLVFDDLKQALKVYHEILLGSMAITGELYFAGLTDAKAEALILQITAVHPKHELVHPH